MIIILKDKKSYSFKNCSKYIPVFHIITINNEEFIEGELSQELADRLSKDGKIKTYKILPGKK